MGFQYSEESTSVYGRSPHSFCRSLDFMTLSTLCPRERERTQKEVGVVYFLNIPLNLLTII